jgi:putative tryptophan/tyrosine transport system substrate-binding protein
MGMLCQEDCVAIHFHRRKFIRLVAGGAAAWPLTARTAGMPVIGYLAGGSPSPNEIAFESGLRDLGLVRGENVAIEYRYAEGKAERLPDLAADLVRMRVDLIVALGAVARQARDATSTIPIVFLLGADPVAFGLVDSFERPGRNLTGTMENSPELTAKRLQLLKEAVSIVTRVGILWQPGTLAEAKFQDVVKNAQAAASTLGVQLQTFEARGPGQVEKVFADMASSQINGLIFIHSPMFAARRAADMDLVAKHRLSAIYEWGVYADAGGLISYGANLLNEYRRVAPYVVKILKGTKPADLPIEQPTKFELVINLKTAKALDLTIPPSLRMRADRVIE